MKGTFAAAVFLVISFGTSANAKAGAQATTIAGSGVSGVSDGSRFRGQFIMPTGIAVDAVRKIIYVADGAAQRIKAVDPDGRIRTVAGEGTPTDAGLWVPGGYRDGSAAQARFSFPTGIAVGAHGELYIADTFNNCIRLLQNGRVSTFAGDPGHPGVSDGPRLKANFLQPRSLAIDRAGDVYVAGGSLRKIAAANGTVSTLVSHGGGSYGIALQEDARGVTLFVSDLFGVYSVDPGGSFRLFATDDVFDRCAQGGMPASAVSVCAYAARLAGGASLGFPYAIAPLNDHIVAFTDIRTNTIRSLDLQSGLLQVIGGDVNENASAVTGGFMDGARARFNTPYGIVATGVDRLLIADAGSKRIRELRLPDAAADAFRPGHTHVAYVGDEGAAYAASRDTSIAGLTEAALAARGRASVDVVAFVSRGSAETLVQLYNDAIGAQRPDVAVLQLNTSALKHALHVTDAELRNGGAWADSLADQLATFKRDLSGTGTRLIVLSYPQSGDFGALEAPLGNNRAAWPSSSASTVIVGQAAQRAGVDLVDLTTAFFAEERSAHRVPIFGVDNEYLAPEGRALVAGSVADALESLMSNPR